MGRPRRLHGPRCLVRGAAARPSGQASQPRGGQRCGGDPAPTSRGLLGVSTGSASPSERGESLCCGGRGQRAAVVTVLPEIELGSLWLFFSFSNSPGVEAMALYLQRVPKGPAWPQPLTLLRTFHGFHHPWRGSRSVPQQGCYSGLWVPPSPAGQASPRPSCPRRPLCPPPGRSSPEQARARPCRGLADPRRALRVLSRVRFLPLSVCLCLVFLLRLASVFILLLFF